MRRLYKSFRSLRAADNVFLPTYTYRMLKKLNNVLPNAHYVVSDFDLLRDSPSSLEGIYAPTVSTKLEAS